MPIRIGLTALAATFAVLVTTPAAFAAAPSPSNSAGRELGVVPVHGNASKTAKPGSGSGSNLVYHTGGSIQSTNNTYAIYMSPTAYPMPSIYQSLLNGFLTNVGAASGAMSNVYYSDTQYYEIFNSLTTFIQYSSKFTGSWVDPATTLPPSGCTDSATPAGCLSDAQIQAEVDAAITANGWSRGLGNIFFVFTPPNIGSCYNSSSCAFTQYCAYHSSYTPSGGGATTIYANQPYTGTDLSGCGSGQYPNGDAASDSTINVISHEHNEAITDPLGNAWYDKRGYENGDKCAWNFGTPIGTAANGASYNQSISTGSYYLQQEWSNHSTGCVLTGT